uniref:Putative plant transposon protein domain-containing protein n=1 Tax=Cajanus cajan TaxID=3821 RepID=A0A151RCW6_CAJCA|nr:hypothetical protein KK1_038278 [Cajanus cajan]
MRVELEAGEYTEFQGELIRRKWKKLATPEKKYNEDIIKEFNANAYPLQRTDKTRNSWVRGAMVSYSRDAINEYLGNPYSLGGDGLDEYGRIKKARAFNADKMDKLLCLPGCTYTVGVTGNPDSFLRKNLTTTARIWQNFLYCNVYCLTHISDLNMPRATLLYSVLRKNGMDITSIISNEIHKIVLSTPSLTGVSKPLGFPGLITGLCLFSGSRLPGNLNKSLRPPINAAYIKIHCKSEQQGNASQPRPQRQWQGSSSSQVLGQEFMAAHFHHIEQKNLENHLALMSLNTNMLISSSFMEVLHSNGHPQRLSNNNSTGLGTVHTLREVRRRSSHNRRSSRSKKVELKEKMKETMTMRKTHEGSLAVYFDILQ